MERTASACPSCGWPDDQPYEVVSRHATSQGVLTWSRCPCGRLRVHRGAVTLASSCARGCWA